jgi:hypothetical protein
MNYFVQTKIVFIEEFVKHSGLSSVRSSTNLMLLGRQLFQQKCDMATYKHKLQFDVGDVLKKLSNEVWMKRNGKKGIRINSGYTKNTLVSSFFANTNCGGWQSHLKISDLVCWHVALDHVVGPQE